LGFTGAPFEDDLLPSPPGLLCEAVEYALGGRRSSGFGVMGMLDFLGGPALEGRPCLPADDCRGAGDGTGSGFGCSCGGGGCGDCPAMVLGRPFGNLETAARFSTEMPFMRSPFSAAYTPCEVDGRPLLLSVAGSSNTLDMPFGVGVGVEDDSLCVLRLFRSAGVTGGTDVTPSGVPFGAFTGASKDGVLFLLGTMLFRLALFTMRFAAPGSSPFAFSILSISPSIVFPFIA